MKKCSICKVEKETSEFRFQNKDTGKLMSACKECSSQRDKKKRQENPEEIHKKDREQYQKAKAHRVEYAREYRRKYPERTRATNWKVKYGITPEEFYNKLADQDNKCYICKRDMNDYSRIFSVDHCHTTGKIRGLLCDPCNYGLGFYEKYKDKYEQYLNLFKDE